MVIYVEDDKNLRELTVYALTQAGISAQGVANDAQFRQVCEKLTPDAVLLDVMLDDTSGLDILARMRKDPKLKDTPVMMLTAKDSELDIVQALDAGADDYLTKPFGIMEMVSRTRALLRRSQRIHKNVMQNELLEVGPLKLSPKKRRVRENGELIELTQREFDLLMYLMRHEDVVCTRDDLLKEVWGWDFDGGTRTVDVHIQQLRSKLHSEHINIETVRGIGYSLRTKEN